MFIIVGRDEWRRWWKWENKGTDRKHTFINGGEEGGRNEIAAHSNEMGLGGRGQQGQAGTKEI